ncbi:type II toxin-antitoxin system HicA family toxin [Marispirochaeta sp.]|uniref:type II toxin-antitoxin system HicA family toxin n=1 Tax=Marispirochaeta sp. TaxID=2038653 RepID=UPI00374972D5
MPRLPRDCDYLRLIRLLKKYGYEVIRQKGSHIRLFSEEYNHSVTIPAHNPVKIGTKNNILSEIAERVATSKDNLVQDL